MRVELAWTGQFGCEFDAIVEIIELDLNLLPFVLDWGATFSAQIRVLGEIELADAWRFVLLLELFHSIKVSLLFVVLVDE